MNNTHIPQRPTGLTAADEEFFGRLEAFAYGQVVEDSSLDARTRALSNLAVLIGIDALAEFGRVLPTALEALTPDEAREVAYTAAAYLGTGRALPFLACLNETYERLGIAAPDEPHLTNTPETRRESGTAEQMRLWGEGVADFHTRSHMNHLVCTHIFGDYYARSGLGAADRALATFCFLYAMGGVDHELGGYVLGNLGAGNSAETLADVIYENIVYVGFPRSLAALGVLRGVTEKED